MARVKILRDNKTGELFYPVTSCDTVFDSEGNSVSDLLGSVEDRFSEVEADITAIEQWPAASITEQRKIQWDNKSNFSGSYTDLTNKPTVTGTNGQIVIMNSSGNWVTASDKTIDQIKGKTTVTHNTNDYTITADDSSFVSVYSSADLAGVAYGDTISQAPGDTNLQLENVTFIIDKTSDTSTNSFELIPNKMYMFGTRESLTITLATPSDNTIVNEYTFQFTSGNTATTLIVPNTVTWLKDPDISTGKKYIVSIENNLGIIGEWENE